MSDSVSLSAWTGALIILMRRNWNLGKGHLLSQALPEASEQPADPVVGGRSPPETLCPYPGTAAEPKACTARPCSQDVLSEPRLGSMTVKGRDEAWGLRSARLRTRTHLPQRVSANC